MDEGLPVVSLVIDPAQVVRLMMHPRERLYLVVLGDGLLRSVDWVHWYEIVGAVEGDSTRRLVPLTMGRDDIGYAVVPRGAEMEMVHDS